MTRLPAEFFARPIAHRGLHDAAAGVVENSLGACAAAVRAGYGVEIDVQLTADGEAVVFHDDTLDRLTNATGPVRAWRAEALRRLPLLGSGEGAPGLAELLALVASRAPLVVEIKDQTGAMAAAGPDGEIGPLEARVAALLADYPGPAAVMSFNPQSVGWFRTHAPDVPTGLVSYDYSDSDLPPERRAELAGIAAAAALAVDFVSYRWNDLPTPATDRLKAQGTPVISWTIRSPDQAEAARAVSDQITFEGFSP